LKFFERGKAGDAQAVIFKKGEKMEGKIKYLKISLKIEIVFGIIISLFMALFLGTMATDSPSSTYLNFAMGAVIGFLFVFLPTVL